MLNYGNLSFHWDVIASNIKNVKQSSNQNNSTRDKYAWNGSKLNVTFTGISLSCHRNHIQQSKFRPFQ